MACRVAIFTMCAALAGARLECNECNSSRILVGDRRPFSGAPPKVWQGEGGGGRCSRAVHAGPTLSRCTAQAMPRDLVDAYTRCAAIPVTDYWVDDTNGGVGLHVRYARSHIDESVKGAQRVLEQVASETGASGLPRHPRQWLPWVLHRYRGYIAGKRVLVLGSNRCDPSTILRDSVPSAANCAWKSAASAGWRCELA
jgi:hypothetical protein